jgi:hypothetical protein
MIGLGVMGSQMFGQAVQHLDEAAFKGPQPLADEGNVEGGLLADSELVVAGGDTPVALEAINGKASGACVAPGSAGLAASPDMEQPPWLFGGMTSRGDLRRPEHHACRRRRRA